MLDAKGDALYVGKARALRKRVAPTPRSRRLPERLRRMVHETRSLEVVTTASRGRGAAARSQPDQAAAAALQHRPARRQVLSLAGADRGPPLSADRQAPRRAAQGRELLRALRLGLGGEPDADRAAARLPAALLPRHRLRHAAPGPACCTRSSAAPRPASGGSAQDDYAELVREAKEFLSGGTPSIQKRAGAPRWSRRPSAWNSSARRRCATASAA